MGQFFEYAKAIAYSFEKNGYAKKVSNILTEIENTVSEFLRKYYGSLAKNTFAKIVDRYLEGGNIFKEFDDIVNVSKKESFFNELISLIENKLKPLFAVAS